MYKIIYVYINAYRPYLSIRGQAIELFYLTLLSSSLAAQTAIFSFIWGWENIFPAPGI